MSPSQTALEQAAGKLVSAIQKQWHSELGKSSAAVSEQVLNSAHTILQAAKAGALSSLLGSRSVSQFLGEIWLRKHSAVLPYVKELERLASQ